MVQLVTSMLVVLKEAERLKLMSRKEVELMKIWKVDVLVVLKQDIWIPWTMVVEYDLTSNSSVNDRSVAMSFDLSVVQQ